MPSDTNDQTDSIQRASAALLERRPSYESMLLFYRDVFIEQEATRLKLRLDIQSLDASLVALKQSENFPLIRMEEFRVDLDCSKDLLKTVCNIIRRHNTALSGFAAAMLEADEQQLDMANLARALFEEDPPYFQAVAENLGIDHNALAYVVYTCLRPSIIEHARQLATTLTGSPGWPNGYCPICGNYPALGTLDDKGRQILHCHFCWHPWPVKRVFCAFCNNAESKNQRYFFSEPEDSLRVNVCDQCGKYLKMVDLRKTTYPVYPPLEQVTTLHLDIKAQEEGYQSGLDLAFKI